MGRLCIGAHSNMLDVWFSQLLCVCISKHQITRAHRLSTFYLLSDGEESIFICLFLFLATRPGVQDYQPNHNERQRGKTQTIRSKPKSVPALWPRSLQSHKILIVMFDDASGKEKESPGMRWHAEFSGHITWPKTLSFSLSLWPVTVITR